jgi:hypothetical protein
MHEPQLCLRLTHSVVLGKRFQERSHEVSLNKHVIVEEYQVRWVKPLDREFGTRVASRGDTQVAGMTVH